MRALLLVALAVSLGVTADAADHPTFESLYAEISGRSDCKASDNLDLIIVSCDKDYSLWYFTKPGHPAHPGVVERVVVEGAAGVSVQEHGWSFAPDNAQGAFKTFLAQLRALDDQMKEQFMPPSERPNDAGVVVGGNWQSNERDNAAVLSLTRHYFRLEDSGQLDDAYALFDSGLTAQLSLEQYKAENASRTTGAVKSRTIKDIDWEKDSPSGPPGLFAAVDYTAVTEHGQLCCYVAWRKQPDDFFILVREETNVLPASLTADQVAQFKAKFHCAP